MSDIKKTIIYTLSVRSNSQNERHSLTPGEKYILGRSDQADIYVDDRKASRKHAQLQFINSLWVVTDNKSTNGLYLDGVKIQTSELKPGDTFAIGNSRITLESSDLPNSETRVQTTSKSISAPLAKTGLPKWFLPILAGLLLLVVIFIGFVAFAPDKKSNNGPSIVIEPETPTPGPNAPGSNSSLGDSLGPSVRDKALALEFYRAGLRFYDTGHLRRAIENWDKAQYYDESNSLVIKRLTRALKALDYEINKHYQEGKVHLKYLRYHEAEQEFMIVTELAQDKSDERYIDSVKKLAHIRKTTRN